MQRVIGFMLTSAGMMLASQVFFMSIEESLHMTDAVVIAEVSAKVTFPMDYGDRTEYVFRVVDVISGEDSLKGEIFADYFMELPMAWTDEEGIEIWESPIVSGSGIEMSVEKGDTVLVFLGYIPSDPEQSAEVVRIEPSDSLDSVLLLLGN